MPRNILGRIDRLHQRRAGTDRVANLNESAVLELRRKSLTPETWQRRASAQPNTRYALGAMAAVSADYTRISLETAARVGNQLIAAKLLVTFEIQGSVPLDVHIRGVSDVDLLTLHSDFFTYERGGMGDAFGVYRSPSPYTSEGTLSALRAAEERALRDAFPRATVDTSGGKAIKIFGGSLERPVDVVPSHWHDTHLYQRSRQKHDRGVKIYDRKVPATVDNLPFLHIKLVHERDAVALGGMKKATRLCKNVKSDAESEGTEIPLPSFDIAAALYHADVAALQKGVFYELAVLSETNRFLKHLSDNPTYAASLSTPDGLRRIFDTSAKLTGLRRLSAEIADLAAEVAREHRGLGIASIIVPDAA